MHVRCHRAGIGGLARVRMPVLSHRWRAGGGCLHGCVLALALVCGTASAQVEWTGDYLARMDADHDGRVSLDEYVDWMGYAFARMDRDGDGVLAADEQPGGKGPPITLEAHRQRLIERFRRQDANGDGWLDARELAAPPL